MIWRCCYIRAVYCYLYCFGFGLGCYFSWFWRLCFAGLIRLWTAKGLRFLVWIWCFVDLVVVVIVAVVVVGLVLLCDLIVVCCLMDGLWLV